MPQTNVTTTTRDIHPSIHIHPTKSIHQNPSIQPNPSTQIHPSKYIHPNTSTHPPTPSFSLHDSFLPLFVHTHLDPSFFPSFIHTQSYFLLTFVHSNSYFLPTFLRLYILNYTSFLRLFILIYSFVHSYSIILYLPLFIPTHLFFRTFHLHFSHFLLIDLFISYTQPWIYCVLVAIKETASTKKISLSKLFFRSWSTLFRRIQVHSHHDFFPLLISFGLRSPLRELSARALQNYCTTVRVLLLLVGYFNPTTRSTWYCRVQASCLNGRGADAIDAVHTRDPYQSCHIALSENQTANQNKINYSLELN